MIIQSPCVGVCKQHPTLLICQGCYRTRMDIKTWFKMSEVTKADTIDILNDRKELYGDINDNASS